jgi:hypothetical protein
MRALLAIVVLALLGACGDNLGARKDAGAGDAGIDAPSQALKHCLDERAALATPPSGKLPCDLLPPGFGP